MKYCNIFQLIFVIILVSQVITNSLKALNLKALSSSHFNNSEEVAIANSTLNDVLVQSIEKPKEDYSTTISPLPMNKILVIDDLMKTDKNNYQKKVIKRAIESREVRKWKLPIKYQVKSNILEDGVSRTINYLKEETCIRFQKVKNVVGNGLVYVKSTSCSSDIGMYPAKIPQIINLSEDCIDDFSILHETLHAIGLEHEMSRRDRDKYITINEKNVINGYHKNFVIEPNTITYNLRYDYGSLMHYERFAFASNNKMTIVPKNHQYLKTMGQEAEVTFNDIKLVNLHYCNNICEKKLKCLNYGYTNPNNCNVCKCPTFFAGAYCEKIKKSGAYCPKQTLHATSKQQSLFIRGKKSCYFQISSPVKSKVKIILESYNIYHSLICQPNKGVEIKYLRDKSVTGIRFCESGKNKNIISEGNLIIARYVGLMQHEYLKLKYVRL